MIRTLDVWLDGMRDLSIVNEDGRLLCIEVHSPLAEAQLAEYERRIGVTFEPEMRALLRYSDGIALLGEEVLSSQQQVYYQREGLLTVHDWGNGDTDCIAITASRYPVGTVVFMNHEPTVTVPIRGSLREWMEGVVEEICSKRTLLHPADYRGRNETGLYAHVIPALRGVRCELNA